MKSPIAYFLEWEKKTPNQVFKTAQRKNWKEITYKETAIEVRKLLQVLKDMGLKKGDHIGILSKIVITGSLLTWPYHLVDIFQCPIMQAYQRIN
ncbi:MAG: hypothetical protein CM15mP65_24680 [Crocinitomicaceae bacterium]|nr:MAG: hypothetical protein CM15mP65_24680 [Crocinitomicaceae bacterium]